MSDIHASKKARILVTPASLCSRPELLASLDDLAEVEFKPQQIPFDLDRYNIVMLIPRLLHVLLLHVG